MNKLTQILQSSNFKIGIITLISLALGFNNIETQSAQVYLDIFSKQGTELLLAVAINFVGIGTKLVSKITSKTWSWGFLKSENFLTQFATILIIIVTAYFGQVVAGVISALLLNIINIIKHSAAPPKYPEVTEASDIKL